MSERRGPTDDRPTRKARRLYDVSTLMQAGLFARRVGPPKGPQPFRFYRPGRTHPRRIFPPVIHFPPRR